MSTTQQNEGDSEAYTKVMTETEDTIRPESPLEIKTHIRREGIEDDDASTASSKISDVATSILLSFEEEAPPLGLSRGWGNSSYDDYEYAAQVPLVVVFNSFKA